MNYWWQWNTNFEKNDDKKTLTLSKNKMTIKYQLWANVILEICHKGIGKVGQGHGLALLDFLFSILFVDGDGDDGDNDDDDDDHLLGNIFTDFSWNLVAHVSRHFTANLRQRKVNWNSNRFQVSNPSKLKIRKSFWRKLVSPLSPPVVEHSRTPHAQPKRFAHILHFSILYVMIETLPKAHGPKALSTLTQSTPLIQSGSFNKLWNLGQA